MQKKIIYSRLISFVASITKCKKPAVKALLKECYNDCRTTTGSNMRRILLDTGIKVIPGETNSYELNDYKVYKIPENQEWKIPLLSSLIEINSI